MTETGPVWFSDFLSVISQRGAEQNLLVHCSCGAPIETPGRKETCCDCGATVEVVRCVPTRNGEKYKLRINKHPWKAEPLLWPQVLRFTNSNRPMSQLDGAPDHTLRFRGVATQYPTRRHLESSDDSKRFLDLGRLILLTLFCLFVSIVSAPTAEKDRPHHYERGPEIHVYDGRGVHTVPNWKRVDD